MDTCLKSAKKLVIGLSIVAVSAFAAKETAEKGGISMSGSFEGGYKTGWATTATTTSTYTGFQVDEVNLNLKATIAPKTAVHVDKSLSLIQTTGLTDISSAQNYWSRFNLLGPAASGSGALLNVKQAYVDHKCAEGWHTWIGLFKVPFGMESMWSKYDMPTYYHTGFYTMMSAASQSSINQMHDLGVKFAITESIPGTLEIALMDGRNATNTAVGVGANFFFSQALRYSFDWKSGDMSLMPVVSAFFGRWAGGPKDMGFGLGLNYKNGAIWSNFEFNYFQMGNQNAFTVNDTTMNAYIEPGYDFGMAAVSLKAEWLSYAAAGGAARTDFNVGAALTKSYDNYRVRLAYNHVGLSGNLAAAGGTAHTNDIRLLVGTKF